MNGWLELGEAVHFLHQADGLLWVQPLHAETGEVHVLNLASGRFLGTPWRGKPDQLYALPFADGLVVKHLHGLKFWYISRSQTLWEREGHLIDADRDHLLMAADPETLVVLDADGTEVHRGPLGLQNPETMEPVGRLQPFAIAGQRVAVVDLHTLTLRDLQGRKIESRRLEGEGFVTRIEGDFVVTEHLQPAEGPRTRFSGAIQGELPGHAHDIAGRQENWVAHMVYPDGRSEAVFVSDGQIEKAPIRRQDCVKLCADERTRLVQHFDGCTWHSSGRLQTVSTTDWQWTQYTLWDGFVIAQHTSKLLPVHPGPIHRWSLEGEIRHTVVGRVEAGRDEDPSEPVMRVTYAGEPVIRGPYYNPERGSVLVCPALDDPPADGEAAQLELLEAPLGIVLEAWSTEDRSWRQEETVVLSLSGAQAEPERHGVVPGLLFMLETGFIEEPLWRFLTGEKLPGCDVLGLVPTRGGATDPFLATFARGSREEVYLVARWPLTRRYGVAVKRSHAARPHWLCDDVEAFFRLIAQGSLAEAEGAAPDWFTLAHQPVAPTRMDLVAIEDAIEKERRTVHTPWAWGGAAYAGLDELGGLVVCEEIKPLDERLHWLRHVVRPLLQATDLAPNTLDGFFDSLAEPGPLLTAFLENHLEPVGPMIGGNQPHPTADTSPETVTVTRLKWGATLPGAVEIFPGIVLWAWPPVGLVVARASRFGDVCPRVISEDALSDLPRLPQLVEELPPPPVWLLELFGEAAPTSELARTFAAYMTLPDRETRTALRQAFEGLGWDLHAQHLAEPEPQDDP